MGYCIRVFAISDAAVSVDALRLRLQYAELPARIKIEIGREESWSHLVIQHPDGVEIATLEADPAGPGSDGAEELARFAAEARTHQPASAAAWLTEALPRTQAIYTFQILDGANRPRGWSVLHELQGEIWRALGGLLHADGEGFSNLEGFHILWEFPDDVIGRRKMAVLNAAGRWDAFEMDLADPEQRAAFLAGQVPGGARVITP